MFRSISYIPLLVVVVSVILVFFEDAEGQVVETRYGKVEGRIKQSRAGRQYHQFLKIAYAKAPISNLRFEPPQRPDEWDEVRQATRYSEPCLQFEILYLGRVQGSEDCLYLNVFTPSIPNDEPGGKNLLPVLVYIHGGGFMSGSANVYKGAYFMDEDVVLVTLNYRLGALGFLTTGDTVVRGNNGLRDQNMALQWVQENIENFGGDPNKVTLFGESVGGASVHYHLLSKASEGLFRRAISQSGNAMRIYALTNDRFGQAKRFAEKFNCPTEDSQELVNCLKKIDGKQLVEAHKDAKGIIRDEYSLFAPVIERVKDGGEFLADEPAELLSSGRFSKIPWLVGVNSGEGLLYTVPIQYDREFLGTLGYPEEWKKYLPTLIGFGDQEVIEKNSERIRREYFQTPIGSESSFQNFTNMFSDKLFFLPAHNAAMLQSRHSPVYMYYFNHPTKFSLSKLAAATSDTSVVRPEIQIAAYVAGSWFREVLLGFRRHFYGNIS
ncbi:unnamed protein product [Orchesella dallaii]|uniref:Carboxylesterase type B domain-containing protein n=1 Tax=Orchesella dallaii TaxID=48710 RepID=A0ABP1QPI4_9HEXA